MNREILFKAKRKDNGEWVEGYYVYCRKRRYILLILNKEIGFDERENELIEIDPGTICQYTGLTDKNGNKIWENDICNRKEKKYILLEKTGGSEVDHIKHATLAVQSFSDTLYSTAKLNEEMKEAMKRITERDGVCMCELNSDYNYTDTKRKKYRYQAVFNIAYY